MQRTIVDDGVAHLSASTWTHGLIALGLDIAIEYVHCLDRLTLDKEREISDDPL